MGRTNATKKKSPSTTAPHPPYFDMIEDAISSLKERTGSSQPAIAKFVEEKYGKVLPPNFRKLLSVQLKKLVQSEKLYKVKNSYKLSSSEKIETAPKEKVVKEKTKKLSQVKTPETLKKKTTNKKKSEVEVKVKRLSQIKTPEALKKKKPNLTPVKRKTTPRPNKRARK